MALYEARFFIILFIVLTLVLIWWYPPMAPIPAALLFFVIYFFRDPERVVPDDVNAIVSPADGKVIVVDEIEETYFTKQKMKRVAIFLSVLDVHVNRAPYAGKILAVQYTPGKFLDARNETVDVQNEAQNWHFQTARGSLVVRQIAGLIARRIVAWKNMGDELSTGERIGMIRFGSRTDLYLPLECEILVKKGDRVQGASTIIAKWKNL
ncbi:MAG: phosphatidylserine decarboxylase family protein [Verrucomicrobiota bacterium]